MVRTSKLGVLFSLAYGAAACVAAPAMPDDLHDRSADGVSDDEAVFAALSQLGYNQDEIVIDQALGLARVDDIVFDRQKLLSGAYFAEPVAADADGFVAKGFRGPNLVSQENVSKIRLEYANLTPVQSEQTDLAAQSWSATPNSRVRMTSEPGVGGVVIHVRQLTTEEWPGPCDPAALACAFPPSNGKPGDIYINNGTNLPGGCTWTPSISRAVMLHELGHALGLTHPDLGDPGRGTLIPGTQDPSAFDPGLFYTIMWAHIENGTSFDVNSCMSYIDYPSNDDRASMAALYPN